jgi:hypothetical protein
MQVATVRVWAVAGKGMRLWAQCLQGLSVA